MTRRSAAADDGVDPTADLRNDDTMRGADRPTATSRALDRRLLLGLGAVRAVTLVWAFLVAAIDAASGVLGRPTPAFVLLAMLAVWSTVWTVGVVRSSSWVRTAGVAVDLGLAMAVTALDPFVYPGSRPQSLASAWPLAAVMASGVALGPTGGLVSGLLVGGAGVAGAALSGAVAGRVLALGGTSVLLAAAGWVAGWVAAQLRSTAEVAAAAEARAEVARTLHDGVLQTLAVVQRRSNDAELVELARTQDAELRAFLRAGTSTSVPDVTATVPVLLGPELAKVEARFGVPVRLVVVDPGTARGVSATAAAQAAAEAATNSAKHSEAAEVWVSVDEGAPSGTLVVVHDEGVGFDPTENTEREGLRSSVRARVEQVGGTVDVRSAPGSGCDVTLWVP